MNKAEPMTAIDDRFLDHPFEVGGRLIDPMAGTVRWQDRTTHLRRKELEVLALMAGAEGAVVSRQAFVAAVWNGNDFVGDRGVSDTISSLRRNLQDDDPNHPLIRTIPRRGYQLAAPVQPTVAHLPTLAPGGEVLHSSGWRLLRKLGESTRSETWLAEASEFNGEVDGSTRQVFRFCRSQADLRNLQREVTLLRYVNQSLSGHPGFAVLRDWQLDEPPYYLRRDFARFGGLREWTQACGMPRTPPLGTMVVLSEALAALHELGVVHRGLGEDCILVDGADDALQFRISALGLSALPDRGKLASLPITALGLTLGADEAPAPSTTADDVVALGLVFLRLSVGDWQAEPNQDTFDRVDSAALQALLRRCFAPAGERPGAVELARGLRSLLPPDDATDAPAGPIEPPVAPPGATGAPPIEAARPPATPETIGRYRLLDRLGEGGMGVVYLAEQRDPYRKVALKIIRSGIDGEQVLSRFEAERQALAMMNHVNVASVHESGLAADGRPFFAMEYIAGEDIKSHCDHHRLSIRARIELFLQVCDGVLHAHQKGVLHRDIKPSNLMVTSAPDASGIVKVIDFGLAKSLHGKLASQTLHTSFGAFVGTPVYSSPEHVSGRAAGVDTRSDIYSMGVVLYELLVGTTPIANESLQDLEPARVREIVCNSRLPSMREQLQKTAQERLVKLAEHRAIKLDELPKTLGGDLSWVVGKCLERDPDDRYASVLALKDDLERWLDLRPVEARPTSGWYRFRKLVRRHRTTSLLIASASAALMIACTAAILGYLRAENALEASRSAEAEATSAADFQVRQMQSVDPAAMGVSLRERLVQAVQERGAQRGWDAAAVAQGEQDLERLIEGVNFTDLSLQQLDTHQFQPTLASITNDFKDQPLLQARLWQSLADSLLKLGRIDAAAEPQRLAVEQRTRLLGSNDPLTLISLRSRGELRIRAGQFKDAEVDLRNAIAGMQRVLGDRHRETLRSQQRLAEALHKQGYNEEALVPARQALGAARQTLPADDPQLLRLVSLMGVILGGNKSYDEAAAYSLEALEGYRRKHGDLHPDTWHPKNNLAVVYISVGRLAEAERILLPMVAAKRAALGDAHPSTLASETNLNYVLGAQGRFAESEALTRQLLETMRRNLGEEHPNTLGVAINLTLVLSAQGKHAEAVELATQIVSVGRRSAATSADRMHLYNRTLAIALKKSGATDEASSLFRDVLRAQRQTLGDSHRDSLQTMTELASSLEAGDDLEGAETLLQEALAGQRKTLGESDQDTVATMDQLAQVLRARGRLDASLALGQESIDKALARGTAGLRALSLYRIHHARTLTQLGRFDDAESLLDQASNGLVEDAYPARASSEELALAYVELYSRRHSAEPGLGFGVKAEAWRTKLEAMKTDPSTSASSIVSDTQVAD
jgi:serine/threonine protein kinase/tetratricopeptide (TPR) repeat protein